VFDRLTKQARQVVVRAQVEARGLRHDYVGSEHLLLGLLAVPDGEAI
jgi:ATP-dependent Clp protease ATP-binding subunit ClpA